MMSTVVRRDRQRERGHLANKRRRGVMRKVKDAERSRGREDEKRSQTARLSYM